MGAAIARVTANARRSAEDATFNAIVAIAVAGVALAITPGVLLHYDITPKLAVLLASLAAVLILVQRTWTIESVQFLFGDKAGAQLASAVLAFWLFVVVSTIRSANVLLSISGTGWRRFGLVSVTALLAWTILIAARQATGRNTLPTLMRTLAISGLAVSIYAIAQFLGFDPWQRELVSEARPAATLGHANYLGSFLIFSTLASFRLCQDYTVRWRYTGLCSSLFCVWALLLTGTRGAVLGLLCGGAIWIVVKRERIPWRRAAAVSMLFCVSFGVFVVTPPARAFRGRVAEWLTDPFGGPRLLVWRDVAGMIADQPLTGYGPELFASAFPRYQSETLASRFPDFYHESPHNILVDAAVSYGIPGLLSFIALVVCAAKGMINANRRGCNDAPLLLGMLAGSFVAHQFACFSIPNAFCFFSICALGVGGTTGYEPRFELHSVRPGVITRFASRSIGVAILAFVVQYVVGDMRLAQAQTLLNQRRLHEAADEYLSATKLYLPGASTDLWFSRALFAAARTLPDGEAARLARSAAAQIGARSLETSETPAIAAYDIALVAALNEDGITMERHLRIAVLLAPNWFKPHWLLAQLLKATGRNKEAFAQAATAVRLDARSHPYVAELYEQLRNGDKE